jgi:peptidoglycan/LPS O-acetylase OafA/YrhL
MNTRLNQGSNGIRIPELDGLRGLAILLVLGFHFINNTLEDLPGKVCSFLAQLTSVGWAGVDLFFVLSGFLIGSILIRQKGSKNYFRTFYIRRLVRIIPNYYLLLVIFLLVNSASYFQNNHFLLQNGSTIPIWSYFAIVHNFFMAWFHKMGNAALSITWSIGIEEQFYIIFPFVIYFMNKKWVPWFLLVTIFAAVFFRSLAHHWIPPYVLLPCRMDAISFGALLAYFHEKGSLQKLMELYHKRMFLCLMAIIGVATLVFWRTHDLGIWRNTFLSIVFSTALLYALYRNNNFFGIVLRMSWLRWVGKISYSLYLFHYLILGIFSQLGGNANGVGIYDTKGVLFALAALLASFVFAWLVYTYLEQPMVRLGKKFSFNKSKRHYILT